ncbi:unnamed protein product [Cuscuta campestris]|uniref:Uncharacterized protein n=1 Tax=Cuscuta campestris TaxID=132261 RepID=A0A484MPP9_9ASTE|nr:unnamed protein product [Cuscuta campestris]
MGIRGIWLHRLSPPSQKLRSKFRARRDRNQSRCRVQEKELGSGNPPEPQDDAREKKEDLDDSMSDSSSSSSSQEEEDSRKGHEEESKEHKSEVELEYGPCSEDAPCRLFRELPEDTPCRVCLRMGCNILVCPLYWGKVPPWVTEVGEDYRIACRLCNCIDDRCGHYGMRYVRLKRRIIRKTA